MAHKGIFRPKFPEKYRGDVNNIVFRSLWERSCMKYFDRNPHVLKWSSEEVVIPYISPIDNKTHRYFVDFFIKIINSKDEIEEIIIEVKPFKQTLPPKENKKTHWKSKQKFLKEQKTFLVNQAKWQTAEIYAQKKGWKFMILTEKEIYGKKV